MKKNTSKNKDSSKSPISHVPKTMAELLASVKTPLRGLRRGDKVEGTVIEKTPKRVSIDIGGKSEGLVAEKAYQEAKDFIKSLEVGDRITASVIIPETPDGYTILSLRNASSDYYWEKLRKFYENDEDVAVVVKAVNPSGLIVDIYGQAGFIPASHVGREVSKKGSNIAGETIKAKIIELDKKVKRVVLSEKYVSEAEKVALARQAMKKIEIREVYDGKVMTVADFGCFVEIEFKDEAKKKVKLEGLVHISELSWEKVRKTSDVVSEGDKVKVKVIGKDNNKLSFSIKQTLGDPWEEANKKYKAETKLKGVVAKISDFGVFVQLEPGIEGLIHITKIPPGRKLKVGEKVEVYVEEVDDKEKRISLGLVLTQKPIGYK